MQSLGASSSLLRRDRTSTSGTVEATGARCKPKRLSQRVRKADVGKLSFVILSMPTEVILRIMAAAEPLTLLQLARSCKMFRRLLLCDSALPVWKKARQNAGMGWEWQAPNSDFSEADWAVLVFCVGCTKCGKGKAVTTDYVFRRRCCPACKQKGTKRTDAVYTSLSPQEKINRKTDGKQIWDFKKKWLADNWWNSAGYELHQNKIEGLSFAREQLDSIVGHHAFQRFVYLSPYLDDAWQKELPVFRAKVKEHGPTVRMPISVWDYIFGDCLGYDPDLSEDEADEDEREVSTMEEVQEELVQLAMELTDNAPHLFY